MIIPRTRHVLRMAPCGVETIVVDLQKEIAEGAFEAPWPKKREALKGQVLMRKNVMYPLVI